MPAPQPEEIYERTKEEGRRRLSRPVLELGATAIVGGFDVAVGLAIFFLTSAELEPPLSGSASAAHFVGAIGFGIGFVFIRRRPLGAVHGELPRPDHRAHPRPRLVAQARRALGHLAPPQPRRRRRPGDRAHEPRRAPAGVEPGRVRLAENLASYSPGTAFLSGLVAGALMTVLTWFVEGAAESMGVRVTFARSAQALGASPD